MGSFIIGKGRRLGMTRRRRWAAGTRRTVRALGDVLLEPGGEELRSSFRVAGHDVPKPPLGFGRLVRVEDAAEVASDLRSHGDLRHMRHGVLRDMELEAMPGHPGEDGLTGCLEPGVVVANDELDAPHATVDEALEEGSPVRLSFGQLHAAAEDAAIAIGSDSDCCERGTEHDRPIVADLFVSPIEDE